MTTIDALDASKAKVDKHYGFNFTEYTITGELTNVLHELRELFIQYHPYAYGSKVRTMDLQDDGTYRAVFWRGNSGD